MTAPARGSERAASRHETPDAALTSDGSAATRAALRRLMGLVALVLGEGLIVTVRVDFGALVSRSEGWARIAREAHLVLPMACVLATAIFVERGDGLRASLRALARILGRRRAIAGLVAAHVGAVAVFAATSIVIAEQPALRDAHLALWLSLWGATAIVAVGAWLGALARARDWWEALRRRRRLLLRGVALAGLAWLAAHMASATWPLLTGATLRLVAGCLRAFYGAGVFVADNAVVGTPRFWVQISPACSGSEGMGLVTVLLSVHLWLERRALRWPRALLVLPIGLAVAFTANVARITTLIVVGAQLSPSIALGAFHSLAGWVLFCAVALGLVALTHHAQWLRRSPAPASHNPVAPWLIPLLAGLATAMATATLADGFDRWQPLRGVVMAAALWRHRAAWRALDWRIGAVPVGAGALVALLWVALGSPGSSLGSSLIGEGLAQMPSWAAASWVAARIAGYVLVTPLAEELAFRGFLQRRLDRVDFEAIPPGAASWPAILMTSLAFGLMHASPVAGTVAGLAYALVLRRSGRLADAVVAHAITNAALAAAALATGSWSYLG